MTNRTLIETAIRTARKAYSPYSGWRVGAAAVFEAKDGSDILFVGSNVENASYGLTICAERTAIFNGVTAGWRKLKKIAISTLNSDNKQVECFSPCGACLQVISEFGAADTRVILADGREFTIGELLPYRFKIPPRIEHHDAVYRA